MPHKDPEKASEYNRKWQEANPEKKKEYDRKWHEANKEKRKEACRKWREANSNPTYQLTMRLKRDYSMTTVDKQAMWDYQGGHCNVCLSPFPNFSSAYVDHVNEIHPGVKRGKYGRYAVGDRTRRHPIVRGLVCNSCNVDIVAAADRLGYERFADPDFWVRLADHLNHGFIYGPVQKTAPMPGWVPPPLDF